MWILHEHDHSTCHFTAARGNTSPTSHRTWIRVAKVSITPLKSKRLMHILADPLLTLSIPAAPSHVHIWKGFRPNINYLCNSVLNFFLSSASVLWSRFDRDCIEQIEKRLKSECRSLSSVTHPQRHMFSLCEEPSLPCYAHLHKQLVHK